MCAAFCILSSILRSDANDIERFVSLFSKSVAVDLFDHFEQVLSVLVFEHGLGRLAQFPFGDPAVAVGDPLEACDLEPLPLFEYLDEDGRLRERIVRSGIEPGEAASEGLHLERSLGEEPLVHRGDLQFPACGGFNRFGHGDHLVRVEV